MNKSIETAARTLISMCTDYLSGELNEDTFVNNLEVYAQNCKASKIKKEGICSFLSNTQGQIKEFKN